MRALGLAAVAAAVLVAGPAGAAVTVTFTGTLDGVSNSGANRVALDAALGPHDPLDYTLTMTFADPGYRIAPSGERYFDPSSWAFTVGSYSFSSASTSALAAYAVKYARRTDFVVVLEDDFAPVVPGQERLGLSLVFFRLGAGPTPSTDEIDYLSHERVRNLFYMSNGGSAARGSDDAPATAQIDGDFAVGAAVPEPATWAIMIAGFGLAGAALRRTASQMSIREGLKC